MFYKLTDLETSHSDWISLNTDSVHSDLIVKACGEEFPGEVIEWINRPEPDAEDEDPPELYGGFVPAQTYVYTMRNDHDASREELRAALDESGFEMFETASYTEHPVEFFFGIDGGGYSFYGAHWIPLRARLAAANDFVSANELSALLDAWELDMEREGESLKRRCPEVYDAIEGKRAAEQRLDEAEQRPPAG